MYWINLKGNSYTNLIQISIKELLLVCSNSLVSYAKHCGYSVLLDYENIVFQFYWLWITSMLCSNIWWNDWPRYLLYNSILHVKEIDWFMSKSGKIGVVLKREMYIAFQTSSKHVVYMLLLQRVQCTDHYATVSAHWKKNLIVLFWLRCF